MKKAQDYLKSHGWSSSLFKGGNLSGNPHFRTCRNIIMWILCRMCSNYIPLYSHYIQRSSHSIPIKSVNRQHMIAFFHICPWFLEKTHHPVVAYSNSPIWISSATMERHRKQPWRKRSWKGRANKKWWIYRIAGWWFVFLTFPYIGNVIIPTDELIFFRSWNHQPDCLFLWKYGISPKMGCKIGKIHLYHLTWWGPPVEKVLNCGFCGLW